MFGRGTRCLSIWLAIVVCALAVTASPVIAQKTPLKINECNGDLGIALAMGSVGPGSSVGVNLTLTNTQSNDGQANPITQTVTKIDVVPSCATLNMGGGCQTPAMGAGVPTVNGASLASTCAGGVTLADNANGTVTFNFGPGPTLAALASGVLPRPSCTVTFNVDVPAGFAGTDFTMVAASTAFCDNPAGPMLFSAGDQNSAVVMVVPTLGAVALVILALVLLFVAWRTLSRRSLTQPAV